MFAKLRPCAIVGVVLSSYAINGLAAESIVYRFNDWTVTVTPGISGSGVMSPNSGKAVPLHVPAPVPIEVANDRQSIIIRPVSLKREQQTQAPAPIPEAVVPQHQLNSDPAPSANPTPQPQAMPGTQQFVSPCDRCDVPAIIPRSSDRLPNSTTTLSQAAMYRDVYASIPFSRVEYAANPSYRNDATLEFLFGQMRQTVINRGTTNVNHYDMNDGYGYGYGYGVPWYYPYYPYGIRITR